MNRSAAIALRNASWEPRLFSSQEIRTLLEISIEEAEKWVEMINGGAQFGSVTFHDLQEFVRDILGISQIPTSPEQVSKSGHWLVTECGWGLDPNYQKYRWVDSENPGMRYTLRGALRIQLEKSNFEGEVRVEFEVRGISPEEK